MNYYRRETVHRGKVDPGVSKLPQGNELSWDHVNRPLVAVTPPFSDSQGEHFVQKWKKVLPGACSRFAVKRELFDLNISCLKRVKFEFFKQKNCLGYGYTFCFYRGTYLPKIWASCLQPIPPSARDAKLSASVLKERPVNPRAN